MLSIISRKQAEYIGSAASVAGGWVMVPDEWANRVHIMDNLSRLTGNEHQTRFLAKLPHEWEMGMPVSPKEIADLLQADIDKAQARTWAKATIVEDLAVLKYWLGKVVEI